MAADRSLSRRALALHDALAFMVLLFVSLALFGVTLFLFKSFQRHRADLAARWTERGETALREERPQEAVTALRTALSYAPDEPSDQLLLAQALANSGYTEEANNYFLSLWDARPGDGFINLQLARLARKRGDGREATDSYRASIFGSWEGDGVVRRREVRLELADFLIQEHRYAEARSELLIVMGNAPQDAALNAQVEAKLQAMGDAADVLTIEHKDAANEPAMRAVHDGMGKGRGRDGKH